jgi:anti-sigma factor RsiW
MNHESHERARQLLAAYRIEGIDADERIWLQHHLTTCPECSSAAEALEAAVRSLRALPVVASAELVEQTKRAVRRQAEQLQFARNHSVALWIGTGVSSVLMILTTSFVWQALAWVGRVTRIPDPIWQVLFLMWWFLPATVLASAAAWRHKTAEWGQR